MKRKHRNADPRKFQTSKRRFHANRPEKRSPHQNRGIKQHQVISVEHDAFVEFSTVDEAWLAKEGLQSSFFHELGIVIKYATHEFYNDVLNYISSPHGRATPYGRTLPDVPFKEASTAVEPYSPPEFNPNSVPNYDIEQNYLGHFDNTLSVPSMGSSDDDMNPSTNAAKGTQFPGQRPGKEKFLVGKKLDHAVEHHNQYSSPTTHCFWRGKLECDGRYVCYVSATSVTRRTSYPLLQSVNCHRRAEFQYLSDLCSSGVLYDICLFCPDSAQDYPGYLGFVDFMKQEKCSMVSKTRGRKDIYIVPPSEFLKNVLSQTVPNRLYGIIFTDVEALASSSAQQCKPDSNHANLCQSSPQVQPDVERRKMMTAETGIPKYPCLDDVPLMLDECDTVCPLNTKPATFQEIRQEYKSNVSAFPCKAIRHQTQQTAHDTNQYAPENRVPQEHFDKVTEQSYHAPNLVGPVAPFPSMSQYNNVQQVQQEPNTSVASNFAGNLPEPQPFFSQPAVLPVQFNPVTGPFRVKTIAPPIVTPSTMFQYQVQERVQQEPKASAAAVIDAGSTAAQPVIPQPTNVVKENSSDLLQRVRAFLGTGESSLTGEKFSSEKWKCYYATLQLAAAIHRGDKLPDDTKLGERDGDQQ